MLLIMLMLITLLSVTFYCRVIRETKGTSHQLNYDESGARKRDVDKPSQKVEIVRAKLSSSKTEPGKKGKDSSRVPPRQEED